ncbi:MAG: methyltransferase domain-containing protein [Candidatus Omnitrophica bacterium]|nr:methyltransferase domain-containing protein [Candidatus Omnitrophota bacterium]
MVQEVNDIRRKFSRAAKSYDEYSSLHREIGNDLADLIIIDNPIDNILEVGCGTGYFSGRIKEKYSRANVASIDISEEMIKKAMDVISGIDFIQADALRLPFKSGIFGLLSSNLAYQWVSDLPLAISETYRVLNEGGKVFLTLFGYNTFYELFEALEECCLPGRNESLLISRLPTDRDIESSLKISGFKQIRISKSLHALRFDSLNIFLEWIKNIGANGLKRNFYLGKDRLARISDYYLDNYSHDGKISSTLEAIWAVGEK